MHITKFEEIEMRKFAISAMALAALAGAPFLVSAQQTDDDVRRTAEAADREDRGEWGWLGLLGLAGLAGLKRRDRDVVTNRDRAAVR
jgi:MYXO-CTERM domain-containing protein